MNHKWHRQTVNECRTRPGIVREDGTVIAYFTPATTADEADLLAAAPELLVACELALDAIPCGNGATLQRVRAAIAQAKRIYR